MVFVFAGQFVQGSDPDVDLYFPAEHVVHAPSEPVVPGPQLAETQIEPFSMKPVVHTHCDMLVLPAGEILPTGQLLQEYCPAVDEYWLTPQISHKSSFRWR
jgi:hypothetical protein